MIEDGDLDELAALSHSWRRTVVIIAMVLVGIALALAGEAAAVTLFGFQPGAEGEVFPIATGFGGFWLGRRLGRTKPGAVPTIRALRDRAGDVAFVLSLARGEERFVAVAGADGRLLAAPLSLVRETAMDRALELVSARCPAARRATVKHDGGPTPLPVLAAMAIRDLPAA